MLIEIDEGSAAAVLPVRDPRGHKGTFGRVSVVAGSVTYAGAALLAGTAALRAGTGLVTLFVPNSIRPHLLGRVPELILAGLPETEPGEIATRAAAEAVAERSRDALVVGPGLGTDRGGMALVRRLLAPAGTPAVVDAAAFDALAEAPGWWERLGDECVLTPHPGELRRLGIDAGTEQAARRSAVLAAASQWRQVVVLKGAGTVIANPAGDLAEAAFELPGMATAGTGDVLAGIVASLLSQGLAPFDAALLGVYLHGRAGEHVSERLGDAGLIASDLLPEIPRVRRHLATMADRADGGRVSFGEPGSTAGLA